MDTNFRKIDIDQYDEDVLVETELYDADSRDPTQVLNDAKQKGAAVRSALARYVFIHRNTIANSNGLFFFRGDTTGALAIVLADPPYGPNVDDAKVRVAIFHLSSEISSDLTFTRT
jgi:actin related protein 2/3 complex, subunit 5